MDLCVARAGQCTWAGSSKQQCSSPRGKEIKLNPCKTRGLCAVKAGACAASSDADCRQSELCTKEGRCTYRNENCIAGSDADCQQSERCKKTGACKASGRVFCIP